MKSIRLYDLVTIAFFYYFVSDAAHRVHPLAGQGVNLGFGDVVCLAEVLAESVLQGLDIGNI